ncbi:hypothetical protein GCM10028798_09810 [Humibacter antri]
MSAEIVPLGEAPGDPFAHSVVVKRLKNLGVPIPPMEVVSWAGGNNPEDWVNEADDYEECEARYKLVDAVSEWERQHEIEHDRERARLREQVDQRKLDARIRRVADEEIAEEDAEIEAARWEFSTAADYDPTKPERVPAFLRLDTGQHLVRSGVSFVFGRRGSMKTWIEYLMLVQLAEQGRPSLLFDFEMSEDRSKDRLHRLFNQFGVNVDDPRRKLIARVRATGPLSEGIVRRLIELYGMQGPAAIVIDSVQAAMAPYRLNPLDMSDVAQWFQHFPGRLAQQWPDALVSMIDHLPHGADPSKAMDPIGSQAKGALADSMFLVSRDTKISKSTAGEGHLAAAKDRDGELDEGETVADFEFGGGGPLLLKAPDPMKAFGRGVVRETDHMIAMAQWVADNEGKSYTAIRDALRGDFTSLGNRRDTLVNLGVIVKRGNGWFKGPQWQSWMNANKT